MVRAGILIDSYGDEDGDRIWYRNNSANSYTVSLISKLLIDSQFHTLYSIFDFSFPFFNVIGLESSCYLPRTRKFKADDIKGFVASWTLKICCPVTHLHLHITLCNGWRALIYCKM